MSSVTRNTRSGHGGGFNALRDQFMVYANRQISKSELQRVVEHFGITVDRAVFMRDGRYQSTRPLHPASSGGEL